MHTRRPAVRREFKNSLPGLPGNVTEDVLRMTAEEAQKAGMWNGETTRARPGVESVYM